MASVFNLKRNSRVFFTTNVDANGLVILNGAGSSPNTVANTQELTVLDGFTFSQTTTAAAVTLNEAGSTPVRGQRNFSNALNPVDFSFSTYMRPFIDPNGATSGVTSAPTAEERVLWNALLGTTPTSDTGAGITWTGGTWTYGITTGILTLSGATGVAINALTGGSAVAVGDYVTLSGVIGINANLFNTAVQLTSLNSTGLTLQYLSAPTTGWSTGTQTPGAITSGVPSGLTLHKKSWTNNLPVGTDTSLTVGYSEVTPVRSNTNQLIQFGLIIITDGITWTIDNCVLESAAIDFGLQGIATVAWVGKGLKLTEYSAPTTTVNTNAYTLTFGGSAGVATGTAYPKASIVGIPRYITNKLSFASIKSNIAGFSGTVYAIALTAGNITIANNATYITPTNLGTLNSAIGYFTGTRSITGTLNAYLKTPVGGVPSTAQLLSDVIASAAAGIVEYKYQTTIAIGGATNPNRIELLMNGTSLQIPTVDASQDIISTAIAFTAQGTDAVPSATASYDVGAVNDIRVRYFSN